ncbi:MAG TPA: HD domain-containing protein [Syntrophomonadaceae bacterium]|nr:HD domain-containing protein [Syntrophomonadaceae bacterium]
MAKNFHEIRDPIHIFIRLTTDERHVVDSIPFQRLRNIHQLAMSYLVYPGATHKRFEHSLGVMELASRVFDVVTTQDNIHTKVRELIPEISVEGKLIYWRNVLRMAALCHDLGHLPFSHAAEKLLLPDGWDHERLTVEFINCEEMKKVWDSMTPPLRVDDIVKLAVGPKKLKSVTFTDWEAILAEIITGDAFGVDRIDYLLRDSHHAGVAYGKFDHFRLIDTLRILPKSSEVDESIEPALGIQEGGLHSAEALLLARYFMYTQVYFHPVRRIYDIHLCDFLLGFLKDGKFPTDIYELQKLSDTDVLSEIWKANLDEGHPLNDIANRIVMRAHFRRLYEKNPEDLSHNPHIGKVVFNEAQKAFGSENVRSDSYSQSGDISDFPVLRNNGRITSSYVLSETLQRLPVASFDYVFIRPDLLKDGQAWLEKNLENMLGMVEKEE